MYKCVLLFSLVGVSLCGGTDVRKRLPKQQQMKKTPLVKDQSEIDNKPTKVERSSSECLMRSFLKDTDWVDEGYFCCLSLGALYVLYDHGSSLIAWQ